jgi:outer membrane protein OmpA-like peptidoglycan-associated protein
VDAAPSRLFYVHSGNEKIRSHYIPSGYMGDDDIKLSGAYLQGPEGPGKPLRIYYRPRGSKGWSGVYWQNPANNWGDKPGQTGFDLRGAARLVFWMRGEKGGEKIHEVRAGGIVGRFPDSDVALEGPITLTKEWKRYEIDLSGKDLRHIIGGFALAMNRRDNPEPVTFYIDNVAYDMPQSITLPPVKGGAVAESTPVMGAAPSVEAPAAPAPPPGNDIKVKSEDAGLRVSFSSQFLFAAGQTVLRAASAPVLSQVIEVLKAYPGNDVLIEGHTDATGQASSNLALSTLRAEHVRDYLVKEGGFDPQRFQVAGYGQTRPVAENDTPGGRALNRRVEVIILKAKEKP